MLAPPLRILVEEYPVMIVVGWPAAERRCPQEVLVSVELKYLGELHFAAQDQQERPDEQLSAVLDYSELITHIADYSAPFGVPSSGGVRLLETFGQGLITYLQAQYPQIIQLDLILEKTALRAALCRGGSVKVGMSVTSAPVAGPGPTDDGQSLTSTQGFS